MRLVNQKYSVCCGLIVPAQAVSFLETVLAEHPAVLLVLVVLVLPLVLVLSLVLVLVLVVAYPLVAALIGRWLVL